MSNNVDKIEETTNPKKMMALESYDSITDKRVFYNINDGGSRLKSVFNRYKDVEFEKVPDVASGKCVAMLYLTYSHAQDVK